MISSFRSKTARDIFDQTNSREARKLPEDLWTIAFRKLDLLDTAVVLEDLRYPPGNRLEALKGDLKGYHSVRINDQWRLIFRWNNGLVQEVDIVDYH